VTCDLSLLLKHTATVSSYQSGLAGLRLANVTKDAKYVDLSCKIQVTAEYFSSGSPKLPIIVCIGVLLRANR